MNEKHDRTDNFGKNQASGKCSECKFFTKGADWMTRENGWEDGFVCLCADPDLQLKSVNGKDECVHFEKR